MASVTVTRASPAPCILAGAPLLSRAAVTRQASSRPPIVQRHFLRRDPKRLRLTPPSTASVEGETAPASPAADATTIVDSVLEAIKDTDGGDLVTPENRKKVDEKLQQLDQIGEQQTLRPLENPLIYGNYEVAYVSARRYGAPAGGRFRSGLGKLLFRTDALCQSVLEPDVVVNKVGFRLLGLLPGSVGLRGKLVSIPEREGGPNRQDTVKVFFDPPVLSLPLGVHIRIGPPSTVVLKTTYVDERVRLGKGSRGSLFVFTRGGLADRVGMEHVGLQKTSMLGKVLLWAAVLGMMANGAWLLSQAIAPVLRAAGLVQLVLGLALGGVVYRGGIEDDPSTQDDRPEVQPPPSGSAAPAAA